MESTNNTYTTLGIAAGVGFIIAIGKILAADENVTVKMAVGRGLITAGLAVAGFSVLTFIPGLGIEGKIGVAALMASLGTTATEMLLRKIVGAPQPAPKDPKE